MAKILRCKHIGPDSNCHFTAHAESEEGILEQLARHAKDDHNIETVPQELIDKALAAITEQ